MITADDHSRFCRMTPLQIDFGKDQQEPVVGIDLGTTNSLVACMDLTHPTVIPGEDGDRLVPSVVSLTRAGEIIVGNAARKALIEDRKSTRLNSSHGYISYAVFCLKKKKKK